jgi:hypothetical protein
MDAAAAPGAGDVPETVPDPVLDPVPVPVPDEAGAVVPEVADELELGLGPGEVSEGVALGCVELGELVGDVLLAGFWLW